MAAGLDTVWKLGLPTGLSTPCKESTEQHVEHGNKIDALWQITFNNKNTRDKILLLYVHLTGEYANFSLVCEYSML